MLRKYRVFFNGFLLTGPSIGDWIAAIVNGHTRHPIPLRIFPEPL